MEYYTFLQLLSNFVILFFAFSVLGWITEVTLKFIQFHRFINRGFFIGPYCPIYGWGAVAITVLVGGLLGAGKARSERPFLPGCLYAVLWNTLPAGTWKKCSMPDGGITAQSP